MKNFHLVKHGLALEDNLLPLHESHQRGNLLQGSINGKDRTDAATAGGADQRGKEA